ncbi:MAG: YgcG family protein [Methylophilaceae bacterium]|nr:YgcG family protein [Methylophilaceae bacterium]
MMRWLAILGLCLLPVLGRAEVEVPPLAARVTDLTGTLTAAQQAALEAKLAAFERHKGSQIAVLVVPTTQPETIEQYSIRVVEQWKLGRKGVDDGVLLLVAKNDRQLRIEVGYGLEGVLNDATAKRIIEESIVPRFKQGDYAGGIETGVDRIIAVVSGEPLPGPTRARSPDAIERYFPLVFFLAVILGGILRAVLGSFVGGVATGGLVGFLAWLLGAGLVFALFLGLFAFLLTLGGWRGGIGGGSLGGGGFGSGGGGFAGGGGGFGGGGASGRW